MATSELAVVAAVSRPERIENIVEKFRAQTYRGAALILCLNGAAKDSHAPTTPEVYELPTEGGTPAKPRNAGLEFARDVLGVELVAFWDDDDYYGPGFLDEAASLLRDNPKRVVGKYARFVRYPNGLYYLLGSQATFLGGTIAGRARELPPIPDLPSSEDHEWCLELARRGFELVNSSARHYVYNRLLGEHAWGSTQTQTLHAYGPALRCHEAEDEIVDGPLSGLRGDFVPRPSLSEVTAELYANVMALPVAPPPA